MVNLDYLYNPEESKKLFAKNFFVDKKLGFQVIKNGTILPHTFRIKGLAPVRGGFGGIIDSNNKHVIGSLVRYGEGTGYTPPSNQFSTAPKLSFTSA